MTEVKTEKFKQGRLEKKNKCFYHNINQLLFLHPKKDGLRPLLCWTNFHSVP